MKNGLLLVMIVVLFLSASTGFASSNIAYESFEAPGPLPYGLAWDGQNLWCADFGQAMIYKLDEQCKVLDSFAAPGIHPTGLAWDGEYLWCATIDGDFYKLDTSGEILDSFYLDCHPEGLTFDGDYLYFANGHNWLIYKITIDGRRLDFNSCPGTHPSGLAWDGNYLIHIDSEYRWIYSLERGCCNLAGGGPAPGKDPRGAAHAGDSIWVSDMSGGGQIHRVYGGHADHGVRMVLPSEHFIPGDTFSARAVIWTPENADRYKTVGLYVLLEVNGAMYMIRDGADFSLYINDYQESVTAVSSLIWPNVAPGQAILHCAMVDYYDRAQIVGDTHSLDFSWGR